MGAHLNHASQAPSLTRLYLSYFGSTDNKPLVRLGSPGAANVHYRFPGSDEDAQVISRDELQSDLEFGPIPSSYDTGRVAMGFSQRR